MTTVAIAVKERSASTAVRNPLTRLKSAARIQSLPLEAKVALRALMIELSGDALELANQSWRRKKAPMAAYWKAVSVYAKHASRLAK